MHRFNGQVFANARADEPLHIAQLLGAGSLRLGVIEAQMIRRDQRAGLAHVVAQHLTQRGVQQMGRGVVARRVVAAAALHNGLHAIADGDLARADRADMRDDVAVGAGIGDLDLRGVGADQPGVADLPAALWVERSRAQHDADALAWSGAPDRLAVADDRRDLAARAGPLVAAEFRHDVELGEDFGLLVSPELSLPARLFLLVNEDDLEAVRVDAQIRLAGDLGDQVKRHAIGVVQQKGFRRSDQTCRFFESSQHGFRRRFKRHRLIEHSPADFGSSRCPQSPAPSACLRPVAERLDFAPQRPDVPVRRIAALRLVALQHGCVSPLHRNDLLFEQCAAGSERLAEAILLLIEHVVDQCALVGDFGIVGRHQGAHLLGDAGEDRRFQAQLIGVVERAADQPPQHVAATLVGGNRAVGDQEGHRPPVLGHDPH